MTPDKLGALRTSICRAASPLLSVHSARASMSSFYFLSSHALTRVESWLPVAPRAAAQLARTSALIAISPVALPQKLNPSLVASHRQPLMASLLLSCRTKHAAVLAMEFCAWTNDWFGAACAADQPPSPMTVPKVRIIFFTLVVPSND